MLSFSLACISFNLSPDSQSTHQVNCYEILTKLTDTNELPGITLVGDACCESGLIMFTGIDFESIGSCCCNVLKHIFLL